MSWRDAKRPPGRPTPPPGQPKPKEPPKPQQGWRKGANREAPANKTWHKAMPSQSGPPSGQRVKLALATLALVAMVGAVIYILMNRPKQVPVVALYVTQYDWRYLPPNAWAAEDFARFRGEFPAADSNVRLTEESGAFTARDPQFAARELADALDTVGEGRGPDKNTVIVYLSAHGVVDGKGAPCLLVQDSSPTDEQTWLRLADVLKTLTDWSNTTRKLLVLDSSRMSHNFSFGQLHNGFADALPRALEDHNDDNLVVLNSTASGETAYTAPELGGSLFGYFFCRGLKGEADASGDDVVTLAELAGYLRRQMGRWSSTHREGRQHAAVFSSSKEQAEFRLAFCQNQKRLSADSEKERLEAALASWNGDAAGQTWKTIDALWAAHDTLKNSRYYSLDPLGWGQFERQLLHLEELALAGPTYAEARDALARQLQDWAQSAGSRGNDLARYNLVLGGAIDLPPPAAPGAERPKVSYLQAAQALWTDRLSSQPGDAAGVASRLREFDSAFEPATRPPFEPVEIHFLRMLRFVDDPNTRVDSALATRDLAEQAATPRDLRAHYWIAPGVELGDTKRRAGEDYLFVGSPDSLSAAETAWSEAHGPLAQAVQLGNEVTEALDLRDDGFAAVPYLAARLWQARLNPIAERGLTAGDVNQHWLALVTGAPQLVKLSKELDRGLAAPGAARGWQDPALLEPVRRMVKLCGEVPDQHYQKLQLAGLHQATLAETQQLLSLPLISASQRNLLRAALLEKLARYQAEALADVERGAAIDEHAETSNAAPLKLAVSASDCLEHPVLTLVDSEQLSAESAAPGAARPGAESLPHDQAIAELARQGGQLRLWFRALGPKSNDLFKQYTERVEAAHHAPQSARPAEIRQSLSVADRVQRGAAASYRAPGDAAQRLRRLDLHQYLVWQCGRALEDFWGPSDAPYFQAVAQDCLRAAEGQAPEADGLRDAAKKRLAALTAVAANPVAVHGDKLVVSPSDARPTSVQLTVTEAAQLPSGTAAAFLRDADGGGIALVTTAKQSQRRVGVAVGNAGAASDAGRSVGTFTVEPAANWLAAPPTAVALYRGHLRAEPLPVTPAGVPIAYTPDVRVPPKVTVQGKQTTPTSVIFVFDCSGSMNVADVPSEAGAAGGLRRRFDVARETFGAILEELARSRFDVGVRFYGHRVSFMIPLVADPKGPGGHRTDTSRYFKSFPSPNPFYPGADHERVQPLRAFGQLELAAMQAKLDELAPWGQTPLYLAISDALEEFRANENRILRIVAITDGFNEQHSSTPADSQWTAERLARLLNAKRQQKINVQIDIVGVGDAFTNEPRLRPEERKAKRDEMTTIAQSTGGRFYPARNARDLLDHLLDSLSPGEFVVTPADARTTDGAPRNKLNTTWTADFVPRKPEKYAVDVVRIDPRAKADVWFEGSERLVLNLVRTGMQNELVYDRYHTAEERLFGPRADRPSPELESLWVGCDTPQPFRLQKRVAFAISLQERDKRRFTRRPAEAWVEITPQLAGGQQGQPYRYCDLNFVADRPVPVLSYTADDFPLADCRNVKIDLFFKPTRTPPIDRSLRDLAAGVTVEGTGYTVQAKETRNSDGSITLSVTESPPPGQSFTPGTIKFEMDPPARTFHYWSEGRHEFILPSGRVLSECQLWITPRAELEKGATFCTLPDCVIPLQ